LTCLLFLEGYTVKTLNWIWGVEIKCPTCRAGCFLLRFIEHSTSYERTKYLTVDHSCLHHEKCLMLRLWPLSGGTFPALRWRTLLYNP
jgi:hypothetical protein